MNYEVYDKADHWSQKSIQSKNTNVRPKVKKTLVKNKNKDLTK